MSLPGVGDDTMTGGAGTVASIRRKLELLTTDIREVRDQGKRAITDPSEISLFKGMYHTLGGFFERYETLFSQLSDTMDNTGEIPVVQPNDHVLRRTMKRYFSEAHALMITLNESAHSAANSTLLGTTTFATGAPRARAKLPTIPLPPFDGDRRRWPRYRDLFESLVIGDVELTDIDRYHYLRTSVIGTPASIVSKLPLTGANFAIAWKALKDVYENKRLLAASYLEQLLELKPLDKAPSAEILATRASEMSEAVAALQQLNIPEMADFMFFHLSMQTLDSTTREAFENATSAEFPSFDSLLSFLRKRSTAIELSSSQGNRFKPKVYNQPRAPQVGKPGSSKAIIGAKSVLLTHAPSSSNTQQRATSKPSSRIGETRCDKPSRCFVCQGPHSIIDCLKFGNSSSSERHQLLRNWKGCRNCLQLGHATHACPSKWRCRYCHNKHHSQLHISANDNQQRSNNNDGKPSQSKPSLPSSSTAEYKPTSLNTVSVQAVEVMLGTAICLLGGSAATMQPIRLVLDSGSHFSFVTRECATRLGLRIEAHATDIWGIGETPLSGFKGRATCTLSPLQACSSDLSASVIVVDTITSPLPGITTPAKMWEPYCSYRLADPEFWVTKPIDFLLGCDMFAEILTGQVITINPELPKLLGTIFGYSVVGRIRDLKEAAHIIALHTHQPNHTDSLLYNELQRFWELEEPPPAKKINLLDEECETLFRETHYRLPCGRYGVRLPFKFANPQFVGSKGVAIRRLYHLETKLERNHSLKVKYHEFMHEYLALGHMSIAPKPAKAFIPHHCVTKGEGDEMKIRVVFDAASRTSSGSLNDALLVGPKLQSDISTILLNFRIHVYVFTADAVKMFRQIEVHPDDRVFQHILFRFDPADSVQEYELNTVSYGTTCAPYLAHRVLRQLNIDEGQDFPLASTALEEDMYVDDIATGASTLKQTLQLQQQVISLMARGGFQLGKWATNHPSLTAACPCTEDGYSQASSSPVTLEPSEESNTIKILGLQWDPKTDNFLYKILPPTMVFTKRGVLSAIAKVYDPLGYLGPAIIPAKEIIQLSWKRKLGWDDCLPPDLQERWKRFVEQLPMLTKIRIPRQVLAGDSPLVRLLLFADASERAYCATAYLHITSPKGIMTNLLLAKTKLAPVKMTTIPRLELCAALLAARLRQSLEPFCRRLGIPVVETFFFTDSTVVLAWLMTPSFNLKTFVANRVEAILDLSKCGSWHHVASADNPSDLGSRGLEPALLIDNKLWFKGPSWAQKHPDSWPQTTAVVSDEIPELKASPAGCLLVASAPPAPFITWISRFSSYRTLVRSMTYLLRFTNYLRHRSQIRLGPLLMSEIREATASLIRIVQAHDLFQAPTVAPAQAIIPKDLKKLHPFFDDRGILLVGGRLRHSSVPWSAKHPILLPSKAYLSTLLIRHYHQALLHPGPTVLLAVLRTKFWIMGARSLVQQITRTCTVCRKIKAPTCQPIMGDLPSSRFREGRPFLHVGTDFAGPFITKEINRRKAPFHKTYLCLFVCLSTKALHLEAVSALTTEAFWAALERFIGRRGLPEKIFSDNGTNFVGASNQLQELYKWLRNLNIQEVLANYAAQREIDWVFTPPTAASFGGLWEAGVKAAKRLMLPIYGENIMTFEEIGTWFIRIEAILNSRPLCPLTADPNDLDYLSPGHFLIGAPLLAVPEPSLVDLPENRLSRWQLVYQKTQHFWSRWRTEYLSTLQERSKWHTPATNLQVGDLVILQNEQAPRLHWPVGRVTEVHPGSDNIVRVATVKTSKSTFKRPVNKLVPLFLPSIPDAPPSEIVN